MERFWDKVCMGEKANSCWEWIAHKDKDGYGVFKLDGVNQPAHRVAWKMAFGPIPRNRCVLHHCDNPGCVHPGHLFIGTIADNNRDRTNKGRNWDNK